MPDSADADPLPSKPPPDPTDAAAATAAAARSDPDMPPRKPPAGGKLKKPLTDKLRAAAEQRLAHLRSALQLRPLDAPARPLPPPHEAALGALGLLDFARLDLASDAPRPDLVASLVAYYDPACRRSFVRGVRVAVSRHDLTRALSLPSKPTAAAAAPPDVDPAAIVPAVMQLLQEYVLLPFQGDDMCILPQEVAAAEQAVREGSAHRVDWAGLIWGLVEKEMLELPKRGDGVCYYGPHLQRLIWAQKPNLFEPEEEGDRGEVVLEASVDLEMDGDDGDADADVDADVKSKSLEELEPVGGDADVRSKSLDDLELGNADVTSKGGGDLELGDATTRNKILEELGLGDVDERGKSMEELEAVDEDSRSKRLDESEAVQDDAKGISFDESEMVDDHGKGTDLDESGLGFGTAEAVLATNEAIPSDNEDVAEVAQEKIEDAAVAAEEDGERSLAERVAVTQEEVVGVAEEAGDEETEGEEEKGATGLSLGINSTNGYDSMDVEEDTNVENLDEGDSGNEVAEESEDDAFEGCNGGEGTNWRIGDGKGDEGMTHCFQRCNSNTFGGMEFENLNKRGVEMRDELRFDDFSGRTSSNLLQAMNSIPASYNGTENVHDLSSGGFLAMGTDAHKDGVDLGSGSSLLFGNNGKRLIDDIDGYNDNMHAQEQFPQYNQQKRMRSNNNSSMSSGSAAFNANISQPIQNYLAQASILFEQKEQEVQSLMVDKQELVGMLQQKDAIIQSLNSNQFEQENKYQAELRRFEHDLNVMAQLVTGYKKALKQTRASFDEYKKKCPMPRYVDVPGGGGLVLSVRELERKQLEEQQQKFVAAKQMIEKFQYEWFPKLDEWMFSVQSLYTRMEELAKEIDLLKEIGKARYATPANEE